MPPLCRSCMILWHVVKVKVTLRPTISWSVSPGFEPHVGLVTGHYVFTTVARQTPRDMFSMWSDPSLLCNNGNLRFLRGLFRGNNGKAVFSLWSVHGIYSWDSSNIFAQKQATILTVVFHDFPLSLQANARTVPLTTTSFHIRWVLITLIISN
jgi:hypothetical protein